MKLAISTTVDAPLDEAVARTREALSAQGFGVLTEIDMAATLKTKIGAEMEDYVILGACNPPLAHRAVTAERQIGLLLPCNVVVRADTDDPGRSIVEAMNPQLMVTVVDNPGLADVADEATARLTAAVESLSAGA
ncbi:MULTISPECIES: DUF302 domain-containing protein [Gordonia]|uniref:DUF302 domain-containing protein n=2 Tax=Gordonia TaxID=2053 RepID=L7LP71_9ACTN|nr:MULTISPECIES: DUF302 domain-containing protein [Gordonia]AUH68002.1 DUF302 domain-containing protein [Gordonia sp. YC-JH1]KJR08643.1 ABC transporter [Gordonia sihwensis]KXT58948.1 ABC transporter [Gordonia sp. QH-12]MBY4569360.1 ABC transporter [Gordonia sihwensis]WFN92269.1 DUF302 domain-containing protein [Gordonia sihwensis]